MTVVPPIKSQGIKTKLAGWIQETSKSVAYDRWVEPFMGTGVVAFNIQPKSALLCDSNPHLINFYKAIQGGEVTAEKARRFLNEEGARLVDTEGDHYYAIRERFNSSGNPLDFLFLSRSCFNGMMRFNKKGGYNVPFCRKPNRFAQALVTKICNQIAAVTQIIRTGDFKFVHQEFRDTLSEVGSSDLVYCDPPYLGRHVDYFDSWSEEEEQDLYSLVTASGASFILSTWLKNKYRVNDGVFSLWSDCSILIKEHFYHVGAKEGNRNSVYEALLVNFSVNKSKPIRSFDIDALEMPVSRPITSNDKQLPIIF
jgi:DNA adenine methylase